MISLSNLFKQHSFVALDTEKRIINADERYFSQNSVDSNVIHMNQFQENGAPGSEEILDGFLAGLEVEEVNVEPQPTPEEILEEARIEAENLIAQAQAEALQIADAARKEAQMLYEQKKVEGYNAGAVQLQAEMDAKVTQLENEYEAKQQELQSAYESRMNTLETDIVDVMISVFHKVFHVQFDNKKQILLHLIKDTLLGVDAGKDFHIRVAEANYKFIESHVADIKEKIGNDVNIDVINDRTLGENDCMIETQTGVFNCGIDMVLDNLEKDIKSLCK